MVLVKGETFAKVREEDARAWHKKQHGQDEDSPAASSNGRRRKDERRRRRMAGEEAAKSREHLRRSEGRWTFVSKEGGAVLFGSKRPNSLL